MKGWTMSGECMLLGSVSSQQRFRVTDIKALGTSQLSGLSWTNHVIALRQISVTALFYLEDSRRIHPRSVRACQPKDVKRREAPAQFWFLFLCFSPPPGPALCKLGQPGVLFVLPEVLTPVLGPSFALFLRAFPFLAFQPPPFWTPFLTS